MQLDEPGLALVEVRRLVVGLVLRLHLLERIDALAAQEDIEVTHANPLLVDDLDRGVATAG